MIVGQEGPRAYSRDTLQNSWASAENYLLIKQRDNLISKTLSPINFAGYLAVHLADSIVIKDLCQELFLKKTKNLTVLLPNSLIT